MNKGGAFMLIKMLDYIKLTLNILSFYLIIPTPENIYGKKYRLFLGYN